MYTCAFYCRTSCLLSCPSELSWCIGQATWENPEAFWVSSVYSIFISTFPCAVSSDFCIPNMWLNTLMYRITVTKPRQFHLLQTTTPCKLHRSRRGSPPTDTLQCLKHLFVGSLQKIIVTWHKNGFIFIFLLLEVANVELLFVAFHKW